MTYSPASLPRSYDWRDDAECLRPGHDPELWHPAGTTGAWAVQIEEAQAVCRSCPVINECARWALDNRESGIWGGMTEQDRAAYRRRRARRTA
ncbi:WhiB family transcriptional regulator [Streptomyces sp. 130]|uniref:WhiB family transcriptional regulator n=1 Tax=Streptomyces sp. 130 TaxID=2591006 RepID=UPI001180F5AE|nr:WhiB family transcriptional regulator [Streptomyces sp. 130]TRV72570.1 WhiB family transcriptional regulator [Streptomyces sp. 130]